MSWTIDIKKEDQDETLIIEFTYGQAGFDYDRQKSFGKDEIPYESVESYVNSLASVPEIVSLVFLKEGTRNLGDIQENLELEDIKSLDITKDSNCLIIIFDEKATADSKIKGSRPTGGQTSNEIGGS